MVISVSATSFQSALRTTLATSTAAELFVLIQFRYESDEAQCAVYDKQANVQQWTTILADSHNEPNNLTIIILISIRTASTAY